ncbi:hypothetical protein BX265_2003 [Streptomyces sp. TLI_235]|nr:hypothetical protein [Streptomyces sp. TLI_235]PBC77261.1 hypothetical protein BX265_2003 [Streptomyces sp. TLI_235]
MAWTGWVYGTLLPLWFAWFGPLVGLLIAGELVLLRGRGRRLLVRSGPGPSRAAAIRRAQDRCAAVDWEDPPDAVRGLHGELEGWLAGWSAVARRSEAERAWVAVVALMPLAAALVAWCTVGPTRLVLFVVVLPTFCLLGLCLALLRLDGTAVERRHSRELLDHAVAVALLACAADLRAPTRRTRAALDEAVGRVGEALDRDARYGISLRPGMRRELVGQAAAASAALDALLAEVLRGRASADGLAGELRRLRTATEACPLALAEERAGAGTAPEAAGPRPGRRALAAVAAVLVGLGILLVAGWAGIDADKLAPIAPVVLLATQVPGMLLGQVPPVESPAAARPPGPAAQVDVPSPRETADESVRPNLSGRREG